MAITYLSGQRIQGQTALAIVKDAQDTTEESASGTTLTISSFTVADNSNRILIVCPNATQGTPEVSGITWNGDEDFVFGVGANAGMGASRRAEIWYLVNPTATTADIVTTWGSASIKRGVGVYSFYNVAQTTPFVNSDTDTTDGSGTVSTGTITPTSAGSLIIDSYTLNTATTDTLTAGWSNSVDSHSYNSQYNLTPTIGVSNNMFWDNGDTVDWVWVGGEIKAFANEDDKDSVTDVPDGSEFEQTDDYKTYQRSGSPVDLTGLKAYWKFNESSGNIINQSTSADSLGSDADLVMTGGTYLQSAVGSLKSVLFDGSDDFGIASTGSNTLDQFNFIHEDKTTICFWLKLVSAVNYGLVIDNTAWGSSRGITMLTESSKNINEQLQNGTSAIFDNNAGGDNYIPDTSSYYFYSFRTDVDLTTDVATMNRNLGDEKQSDRQNAPSDGDSSYALNIGRRASDANYINMEISELSIWNRILTDDELIEIYNGGSGASLLPRWVERGTAI